MNLFKMWWPKPAWLDRQTTILMLRLQVEIYNIFEVNCGRTGDHPHMIMWDWQICFCSNLYFWPESYEFWVHNSSTSVWNQQGLTSSTDFLWLDWLPSKLKDLLLCFQNSPDELLTLEMFTGLHSFSSVEFCWVIINNLTLGGASCPDWLLGHMTYCFLITLCNTIFVPGFQVLYFNCLCLKPIEKRLHSAQTLILWP